MQARLVERDAVLRAFGEAIGSAVTGRGSMTFLAGEAGIGKTTVVSAFVEQMRSELRTLVGACDALATPRPLGPLRDMAVAGPAVAGLLDGRPRHELFTEFLQLISTPARPALVVFEDVLTSLPLEHPDLAPITLITSYAVLGRLRARRGDSGPTTPWSVRGRSPPSPTTSSARHTATGPNGRQVTAAAETIDARMADRDRSRSRRCGCHDGRPGDHPHARR